MADLFSQSIKDYFKSAVNEMHTAIPGHISKLFPDKCECYVKPDGKLKKNTGEFLDYPEITEVPISLIQSYDQTAGVLTPVKEGDGVMIIFAEQQLDQWRNGQDPTSELHFDLSSGMAIVGLCDRPNSSFKEACDDDAVIIYNTQNSRIKIKNEEININAKNSQIDIKDSRVTVQSGNTQIIVYRNGTIAMNTIGHVTISGSSGVTVESGSRVDINAGNDVDVEADDIYLRGVIHLEHGEVYCIE